jgi:hypothetical protein
MVVFAPSTTAALGGLAGKLPDPGGLLLMLMLEEDEAFLSDALSPVAVPFCFPVPCLGPALSCAF